MQTLSPILPIRRFFGLPFVTEATTILVFAGIMVVFSDPRPDPMRVAIGTVYACLGILASMRSTGASGEAAFADRIPAAIGWGLWVAGFVTVLRWVGGVEETLLTLVITWVTFLIVGQVMVLTPNRHIHATMERDPAMDGPELATWRRWQWIPAVAILILGFTVEAHRNTGPDGLTLAAASFLALAMMSSRFRMRLAPWRRAVHRVALLMLLALAVILPEGGLWSLLQIGNSHPI